MHIFIFDFDMTLSVLQTDGAVYKAEEARHLATIEAHNKFIQDNMKAGVAELFRRIWANGHAIAIATFCEDQSLLLKHLSAAGLSPLEIDRITIEFRPSNFIELQQQEKATNQTLINKNEQIHKIIASANPLDDVTPDNFTLIDDSNTNLNAAKASFPGCNIIKVNNFVERDGLSHANDFIAAVDDKLSELPRPLKSDLDHYCDGFFHRAEQKISELDRFYKIYGTTKANFIRHAIAANKEAINQLKNNGQFDTVNVERVLKETASADGKTLKQALGYHRLFSFKSAEDRDAATSLTTFTVKHRFI